MWKWVVASFIFYNYNYRVGDDVPTTVQVDEKTLQLLNKLKKEMGARSHDEVIKTLISERKKISRSMFGTNPKLKPFSREEEAECHEL
ncbi:MAG: ribbon-helix-helix protein, CopG family [Candidatus Bathyarchaeia archaeon]